MDKNSINNYNEFYEALQKCGFSLGGANDEGIFSLCSSFTDNIIWHTENPETDPWEWRMRVLDEEEDGIKELDAVNKITQQILLLNPNASDKKIKKFIYGF